MEEVEKPKISINHNEHGTVTFCLEDNCFQRADKLFRYIRLSDTGELSCVLAKGLQVYMDLDRNAAKIKQSNE